MTATSAPFFLLLSFLIYTSSAQYLGCYSDNYNNEAQGQDRRDLPTFINGNTDATPTTCVQRCANAGYYFAGLQNGGECWCGNSYGKYCAAANSAMSCGVTCSRDSGSICGGRNFNSVYRAAPGGPSAAFSCSCGTAGQCVGSIAPTPAPTPIPTLPPVVVRASTQFNGCSSLSNTGSLRLSATGGKAPYTFSVNDGPYTEYVDYNFLKQGNVNISAMDSRGFTSNSTYYAGPSTVVSVSVIPYSGASLGQYYRSSTGDFFATLTVSAANTGTAPYKYAIYPKGGNLGITISGSSSASFFITPGSYSVYATDANGCQSSAVAVTIKKPSLAPPPSVANISVEIRNQDPDVLAVASWAKTVGYDMEEIYGYSVQFGSWNGSAIVWDDSYNADKQSTTYSVPIVQSTRRFFRVATTNIVGTGAYSAPLEFQGLCAAGRYPVKTNCSYCPSGTSTNGFLGKSSCKTCVAGTYSAAGSASCTYCTGNTYSTSGASSCSSCPAGYITATTYCKPCEPGTYNPSPATNNFCSACPANTYSSNAGSSSCVACPTGTTSETGSNSCYDPSGYKK